MTCLRSRLAWLLMGSAGAALAAASHAEQGGWDRPFAALAIAPFAAAALGWLAWRRAAAPLRRRVAKAEREAARLRLAASVFDASAEGILLVSPTGQILALNEAFGRMTGYRREELIGRNPRMLQSGRHDVAFYAAMWASLRTEGQWRGQLWDRRRDGSLFAALVTISAVHGADGALSHYVALFSDITEMRRRQDEVERLAFLDPLTGLANRRLLAERLSVAIRDAAATGRCAAVCMVDLDGFKAVNDAHGHAAGDAVLVASAQRLQGAVRSRDTVVRTGGDEFVIVLTALVDEAEALEVAQRVRAALTEPVALLSGCVTVGASLGLACYPRDGADVERLLRLSDDAMYRAKGQDRDRDRIVMAPAPP
ncbi:sensor domain-containing diguanylate cyclase [[Empedobacter] haloabium]|uniref:Sensor domain-containing diguanylate cyclase n=1 Tax=[Empedobacter] haloabium TaxID=592317 RepID=A0ABZ1UDS8_9BURK